MAAVKYIFTADFKKETVSAHYFLPLSRSRGAS